VEIATLPSAKLARLAASQRRCPISLMPPATSCTKACRSALRGSGTRMARRNAALTAKLAESIAKTHPGPTAATSSPETAGPSSSAPCDVNPSRALACCSRPVLTVAGTNPVDAGLKNA